MQSVISVIADFCSIAGFVLTIAIWKLADKIRSQTIYYQRQQKDILTNLKAQRDCIRLDDIYTIRVRSELRTELYSILKNYNALLSVWESFRIRWIIHILRCGEKTDRESLCANLDYVIARFQRKETSK